MFVKPNSFHLQWHITDKCNLRCRHCYKESDLNELTTKELFIVLNQYIDLIKMWGLDKNKKIRKLSLSGGEPLLRKDFFRLLEEIYKNRNIFTSVIVMSNGSIISDRIAKKFKDLDISAVQISLDGMEEENDKIRGRGNFKKAVGGIEKLIDNKVPVSISMTVHKENVKDIEDLIDYGSRIGVKSFGFSRLVPLGRGKRLKMLEPLETNRFYEKIMKLKAEWGNRSINISTHCSDSLWFIEDPNHQTHGCSAGYDSFSIMANGDVVPCRRLPIKVGNVLEKSLFEIWYTSGVLWNIRNRNMINNECKKCGVFTKCYGGAKCVANGYFGSLFAPDPQCWKLFKKLPSNVIFSRGNGNLKLAEEYVESFDFSNYFM